MESKPRSGFNGVESQGDQEVKVVASSPVRLSEYILRFVAVANTLVAAVVMGVDKETKTVDVSVLPTLAPLPITVTAKSIHSSAFVYFIVANAIACAYSALSLILSIIRRTGRGNLALPITAMDLLVVALLFSGNGAATAIAVVGKNGDSHAGWKKICDVYGNFCAKVSASIMLSLLASLAYVVLALLNIRSLHNRSP